MSLRLEHLLRGIASEQGIGERPGEGRGPGEQYLFASLGAQDGALWQTLRPYLTYLPMEEEARLSLAARAVRHAYVPISSGQVAFCRSIHQKAASSRTGNYLGHAIITSMEEAWAGPDPSRFFSSGVFWDDRGGETSLPPVPAAPSLRLLTQLGGETFQRAILASLLRAAQERVLLLITLPREAFCAQGTALPLAVLLWRMLPVGLRRQTGFLSHIASEQILLDERICLVLVPDAKVSRTVEDIVFSRGGLIYHSVTEQFDGDFRPDMDIDLPCTNIVYNALGAGWGPQLDAFTRRAFHDNARKNALLFKAIRGNEGPDPELARSVLRDLITSREDRAHAGVLVPAELYPDPTMLQLAVLAPELKGILSEQMKKIPREKLWDALSRWAPRARPEEVKQGVLILGEIQASPRDCRTPQSIWDVLVGTPGLLNGPYLLWLHGYWSTSGNLSVSPDTLVRMILEALPTKQRAIAHEQIDTQLRQGTGPEFAQRLMRQGRLERLEGPVLMALAPQAERLGSWFPQHPSLRQEFLPLLRGLSETLDRTAFLPLIVEVLRHPKSGEEESWLDGWWGLLGSVGQGPVTEQVLESLLKMAREDVYFMSEETLVGGLVERIRAHRESDSAARGTLALALLERSGCLRSRNVKVLSALASIVFRLTEGQLLQPLMCEEGTEPEGFPDQALVNQFIQTGVKESLSLESLHWLQVERRRGRIKRIYQIAGEKSQHISYALWLLFTGFNLPSALNESWPPFPKELAIWNRYTLWNHREQWLWSEQGWTVLVRWVNHRWKDLKQEDVISFLQRLLLDPNSTATDQFFYFYERRERLRQLRSPLPRLLFALEGAPPVAMVALLDEFHSDSRASWENCIQQLIRLLHGFRARKEIQASFPGWLERAGIGQTVRQTFNEAVCQELVEQQDAGIVELLVPILGDYQSRTQRTVYVRKLLRMDHSDQRCRPWLAASRNFALSPQIWPELQSDEQERVRAIVRKSPSFGAVLKRILPEQEQRSQELDRLLKELKTNFNRSVPIGAPLEALLEHANEATIRSQLSGLVRGNQRNQDRLVQELEAWIEQDHAERKLYLAGKRFQIYLDMLPKPAVTNRALVARLMALLGAACHGERQVSPNVKLWLIYLLKNIVHTNGGVDIEERVDLLETLLKDAADQLIPLDSQGRFWCLLAEAMRAVGKLAPELFDRELSEAEIKTLQEQLDFLVESYHRAATP